jgi:hypothetical protein
MRKLLFFNHNFGTNEQWEVVTPQRDPWTSAHLQLQHRRFRVRTMLLANIPNILQMQMQYGTPLIASPLAEGFQDS